MKPMKFALNIIGGFLLSFGLFLIIISVLGISKSGISFRQIPANFSSLRAYIVQSGSMEPAVKVGSLVLVNKDKQYSEGDIITFSGNKDAKNVTTHRIIFKNYPNGINQPPVYLTKGDKNGDVDTAKITDSEIVGKVFFTIPYFGYISAFIKAPNGFILLVIIPATIIIYEELKSLLRELKKFWQKIKNKFNKNSSEFRQKPQQPGLFRLAVIIPFFAVGFLLIMATNAYFSDKESSQGNVFSAATSFGSPVPSPTTSPSPSPETTPIPIAQTLVINEVLPDTSCMIGQKEAQWLEVYNGY